jgi:hypothetical protein
MPGGLLSLVCYGDENELTNGNPQVTWFYKGFLRHTHFSQEPIQIPLEGPNLLTMDSPVLLKAKIPRQGDLLSDLVLRFNLPSIYSKAFISSDELGRLYLDRAYEFQWVRQIGARLIDTVTFTIGGQKIQEFNSDWIVARALMDLDNTQYNKWRYMVGDVPECFDPANGIYADLSGGVPAYPHVVAWRGSPGNPTPTQNNAPSIPGRVVRVPLGLWFSDYIANSLPLVGLQYLDAEIQIQLRPLRDLYTVLDPSGVRIRPGVRRLPYIPTDQYTGIWDEGLYGPLPDSLANLYAADTDPRETLRYFLTDISGAVPTADGWPLNATLEATYTFVTTSEQLVFAKKTLRYNVRQVQYFPFYGVNTRATYRLDVHNIATRMLFFARRSDAIPYRNQRSNLTNWMYPLASARPYVTPLVGMPTEAIDANGVTVRIGRSGLDLAGLQRRILRSAYLTANGQPLFDAQDAAYFNEYVPFRYHKGDGAPFQEFGLATQSEMWPLHVYSFALEGSSVEQPKGTLNTSRINRLELDADVEPIPVDANYTYELHVYMETMNFLEISSGLGGLKFAK